MNIKDLFEKWGLSGVKLKTPIMDMEWEPSDPDKNAAWDLYVELLTRVSTQRLSDDAGTEIAALDSVYGLFDLTRTTLKQHGRKAEHFTKIAIIVLNQIIRPFTSKWHKEKEIGSFSDANKRVEFRQELRFLQNQLRSYTQVLAELADVEDLTDITP